MNPLIDIYQKALIPSLNYQIGNISFTPSYLQAGAIIFLLFLLVLTFARLRRLYLSWSIKGGLSLLFVGFFLALILEGFFVIGGRTVFTEILGWKNPPKPIGLALDAGREKLVKVLGITDEIPSSKAQDKVDTQLIIDLFDQLNPQESQIIKDYICQP